MKNSLFLLSTAFVMVTTSGESWGPPGQENIDGDRQMSIASSNPRISTDDIMRAQKQRNTVFLVDETGFGTIFSSICSTIRSQQAIPEQQETAGAAQKSNTQNSTQVAPIQYDPMTVLEALSERLNLLTNSNPSALQRYKDTISQRQLSAMHELTEWLTFTKSLNPTALPAEASVGGPTPPLTPPPPPPPPPLLSINMPPLGPQETFSNFSELIVIKGASLNKTSQTQNTEKKLSAEEAIETMFMKCLTPEQKEELSTSVKDPTFSLYKESNPFREMLFNLLSPYNNQLLPSSDSTLKLNVSLKDILRHTAPPVKKSTEQPVAKDLPIKRSYSFRIPSRKASEKNGESKPHIIQAKVTQENTTPQTTPFRQKPTPLGPKPILANGSSTAFTPFVRGVSRSQSFSFAQGTRRPVTFVPNAKATIPEFSPAYERL